jgi:hypothetical protein
MDARSTVLTHLGSGNRSTTFAEIDVRELQGSPLAGRFQLRFMSRVTLKVDALPANALVALHVWADVMVGHDSGSVTRALGATRLDGPIYFDGGPQVQTIGDQRVRTGMLVLDLDRRQLDALEEVRAGRDLVFTFRFSGVANYGGGPGPLVPDNHTLQYSVSQSEWVTLLSQLGYAKYLTLDLQIPDDPSSTPLGEATRALQNAVAALQRGEVEEAIADCRSGIAVLTTEGDRKFDLKQPWSKEAGKSERFWRVGRALMTVSHAAHHPEDFRRGSSDGGDAPTEPIAWDRSDAKAVIAVLAALINQRAGH